MRPRSECRRTAVGISVQRTANPAWCGLSSVCATHPRAMRPCSHAMRCAHMNVLPKTQARLRPTPRPCGRGGQQRIALPRCPARRRRDRSALGAPSPEEYLKVITGKLRRAGGEGGCPTPRRMPVQHSPERPKGTRKDLSPLRGGRGDSSPRPCQEGLPTIGAPHRRPLRGESPPGPPPLRSGVRRPGQDPLPPQPR